MILSIISLVIASTAFTFALTALNRTVDKKKLDFEKSNRVLDYAKKVGIKNPYITDVHGMIGLFEQREDSSMVFVADIRLSEQKIRRMINKYQKENITNDEIR